MKNNELQHHINELQNGAIDTITNPIKDIVKLSVGLFGVSFSLIKSFGEKITNIIEK